jgi:hypothetical protein
MPFNAKGNVSTARCGRLNLSRSWHVHFNSRSFDLTKVNMLPIRPAQSQ